MSIIPRLSKNGSTFHHFSKVSTQLTQHIAVKTLFGLYNETELDQMGKLIHNMTKSLLFVTLAPINLPGTPYSRAVASAKQLDKHIRGMIAEKQSEFFHLPEFSVVWTTERIPTDRLPIGRGHCGQHAALGNTCFRNSFPVNFSFQHPVDTSQYLVVLNANIPELFH